MHGADDGQSQVVDGLVGQLGLEFRVQHVHVYLVVLQLVQYVEGGVVGVIVRVGVECARRVQCVRIGVDVEIAFHLSVYHVHILRQRARRLLFAVRNRGQQREREIVEQVMGGVYVGRVTPHGRRLVPARVGHERHRYVIVRLARAAAQTYRVVLHECARKQLLKPVGVAHFGTV